MGFDPCSGVDCRARLDCALGRASLDPGNLGRRLRLARRRDRQLDRDVCPAPIQCLRRLHHHVFGQLDILLHRDTGSCVGQTQLMELIQFSWAFDLVAQA